MIQNESKINLPSAEVGQQYCSEQNEANFIPNKGSEQSKNVISGLSLLRQRICETIHSHNFQIVIIVLVLLDCAIVIAEIMLETSKNSSHAVHVTEEVLHYFSLSILSLFFFEVIVKVFCMGLSFFHYKMEVFDACVVIISFFLDIFLSRDEPVKDGVEFIVLLRLWRITRVINGIILSVKTQAEEKLNNLRDEKDNLVDQVNQLQLKVNAQKKEIVFLREHLTKLGVDVDLQPNPESGL